MPPLHARAPRGARGYRRAEALRASSTASRSRRRPGGAGSSARRRERRRARRVPAGRARGAPRARGRARSPARRSAQTVAVGPRGALLETSRIGGLPAARAPVRPRPARGGVRAALVSPKRELVADRLAAELCGSRTGSPTRCSGSSRRWSRAVRGEPGDGAALHDEPVRGGGPRRRCSGRIRRWRARSAAARARPGVARPSRGLRRRTDRKRAACAALIRENNRRRPTLPGDCSRVPSALAGLTSLFGMGRGVSLPV